MNSLYEALNFIQSSITKFDNKATSLLTAVGVIFSFSLLSLDSLILKEMPICFYVSGAIYLLSFLASIICLVLVIVPRGKKKSEKNIVCNLYHGDVYACMDNAEFGFFVKKSPSEEELISQIKSCAKIAHIKEVFLGVSSVFIILLSISLVTSVIILLS